MYWQPFTSGLLSKLERNWISVDVAAGTVARFWFRSSPGAEQEHEYHDPYDANEDRDGKTFIKACAPGGHVCEGVGGHPNGEQQTVYAQKANEREETKYNPSHSSTHNFTPLFDVYGLRSGWYRSARGNGNIIGLHRR